MTIDQFRAEYHLLDRVSDGTVQTYHAQAAAGVMVMVHFLRGTESRNAAILERIERLEAGWRQKVIRIIDVDGVTAVVTRFILELTSFEDWLGVDVAPADLAPADTPAVEGSILYESTGTVPGDGPAPEASTATPGASALGEFTGLFRTPAPAPDPASPATPSQPLERGPDRGLKTPEPKPSAHPHEPGPGEFTRVFGIPAIPARNEAALGENVSRPARVEPRPTADPPPSSVAPRAPAVPPPRPTDPPMPEIRIGSPPTSKAGQPREPGEYTRLVNPHLIPEPPFRGKAPPAYPGPGGDERAGPRAAGETLHYGSESFRERLAAPSPDASLSPPRPAAPLPPVAPIGPGEYTKVIESMPTPNLGSPQRSPSRAPPPPLPKPPSASNRVLFFALLGVLLAAILFVVIFAILT
ncbi:MAG: hypothetical protein ACREM1_00900 [Longimicrobiales bacterium]